LSLSEIELAHDGNEAGIIRQKKALLISKKEKGQNRAWRAPLLAP
jgi:hypothetical protein